MAPHILVVGGTGMLSGLVEALAGDGGRLSLLSRHASRYGLAGAAGYDVDYYDEPAFRGAVDRALADSGRIDLAVGWFHTLKIAAPRILATATGSLEQPGKLFQVLGSATADPAQPEHLALAKNIAAGVSNCEVRQVVLGFQVGGSRSRWLTDDEISEGVLQAIRADRRFSVVGTVEPWAARP